MSGAAGTIGGGRGGSAVLLCKSLEDRRSARRDGHLAMASMVLWQTATMSDSAPDLHMLNVVVGDMAASVDFYRRLGVVPDATDTSAAHLQLKMPGGFSLELDTAESARLWHAGWRADPSSAGVVIGFSLPNRAPVDEAYPELTAAGHPSPHPPFA